MKKLIIFMILSSLFITGCSVRNQTPEISDENPSAEDNSYFSYEPAGNSVTGISPLFKSNKSFVNKFIEKYENACEITTYEYDMFINYESYRQNYINTDDHPSYEYITDYLNLYSYFDFIYPLYYAGWPYGEIWKYNSFCFNENNFTLWDIYNVPKNNKNRTYSCWVRGYLENGYVVKTFSYKKDNIESTIENYRTKNENVYQLFFKKNNEYIYGIKSQDGKWEFFTDKNDINHFYKTMAFYYFTAEPTAE